MQHTTTRPAGKPLRVVLVALLLAGLGLWQSWQCTDDMAPLLMPAAMAVDTAGHGEHVDAHEHPPVDGSGHGGLAAACMSVLAAVAGALLAIGAPRGLPAMIARAGQALVRPVEPLPRPVTLAQLCILRT